MQYYMLNYKTWLSFIKNWCLVKLFDNLNITKNLDNMYDTRKNLYDKHSVQSR